MWLAEGWKEPGQAVELEKLQSKIVIFPILFGRIGIIVYLCSANRTRNQTMQENTTEAYKRLSEHGVRPSLQRVAIMDYLLHHYTHPTVEDVYQGLNKAIPSLSRTTVYNTLRMLSEHHAAQMITIDDHRVCYDGNVTPHVHFFCKQCGRVSDLFGEQAPSIPGRTIIEGNVVDEAQLYYKGICKECSGAE